MSRRISLNARTAHEHASTEEVEVMLFYFEHEELDQPVRLSTDPTERISADPLLYGTRSSWLDTNPSLDPFWFVLVSADFPSDMEDAPAAAAIVLENVDNDIAAVLRSVTGRATVHVAVVLASSPDLVEAEYRNLKLISAEGDAGEVSLSISRHPIEEESYPADRMTKQRMPGLHR